MREDAADDLGSLRVALAAGRASPVSTPCALRRASSSLAGVYLRSYVWHAATVARRTCCMYIHGEEHVNAVTAASPGRAHAT